MHTGCRRTLKLDTLIEFVFSLFVLCSIIFLPSPTILRTCSSLKLLSPRTSKVSTKRSIARSASAIHFKESFVEYFDQHTLTQSVLLSWKVKLFAFRCQRSSWTSQKLWNNVVRLINWPKWCHLREVTWVTVGWSWRQVWKWKMKLKKICWCEVLSSVNPPDLCGPLFISAWGYSSVRP